MKILPIALNTFREAIRNKILYSAVLFAAVLVCISALFGSVTIGSVVDVIKDFGLFSLSFLGAVVAILSGVSLLNKEIKAKTIYNILSKPVNRWEFIFGKHLGVSLTVCLLVSLMGLGLVGFSALFEGTIDWLLFQGIFFVLLEVLIICSITIFFSCVVITVTLSGLFTLAFYIGGRSITYLQYFLEGKEINTPIIKTIVQVFDLILPDLSLFAISDTIVNGQTIPPLHCLQAITYAITYSTTTLILSTLIFQKRELV